MTSREKKLLVLRLLGQEADPLSLPELLAKLPADYAERTTRRWLNDLVDEGLVKKSGQKRGTRYRVIKKNEAVNNQVSGYFSSQSARILEQVRQPIYGRSPISYNEAWFDDYEPNKTFYLPKNLKDSCGKLLTRPP